MSLELTVEEEALLVTILRERQRQLLHEIARADFHEFRGELQQREATLESLLRKLVPEAGTRSAA